MTVLAELPGMRQWCGFTANHDDFKHFPLKILPLRCDPSFFLKDDSIEAEVQVSGAKLEQKKVSLKLSIKRKECWFLFSPSRLWFVARQHLRKNKKSPLSLYWADCRCRSFITAVCKYKNLSHCAGEKQFLCLKPIFSASCHSAAIVNISTAFESPSHWAYCQYSKHAHIFCRWGNNQRQLWIRVAQKAAF